MVCYFLDIEGYLVELRQKEQNRNSVDGRTYYNDSLPSENRGICNLLCFTVFTRAHGSDARLFTSRGITARVT